MNTNTITKIAMLTTILFVQEQALMLIPNIQLTFLLIIVYSRALGTKNTLIVIGLHVLLDNLYVGTFNLLYILPMFISYSLIPITMNTIFKNINNTVVLSLISVLYVLTYSISFAIASSVILHVPLTVYLISDIPFTIILVACTSSTVVYLYTPLVSVLDKELYLREEITESL